MKLSLLTRTAAVCLGLALFGGCQDLQNAGKPKDDKPKDGGGGGGQPEYDPTSSLSETTPYGGWPKDGAGLKKGWFFETTTTAGGQKSTTKWAVVDAAGDVFKVETNRTTYALPGGWIEAIEINKDGTVPNAYVGKPGKGNKVKAIKVNPTPKGDAPKPEESDESITVAAGTFQAHKVVIKTTIQGKTYTSTSWSGTDGDVKDVCLKVDGGSKESQYELAKAPEMVDGWKCGSSAFKVKHLTYSNGQEQWFLVDGPWPIVGAMVKMSMTGYSMEITNMGSDAAPQLSWEKEAAK